MKKYLPLILLIVGLLAFAGVFMYFKSSRNETSETVDETDYLVELSEGEKPLVYLIPSPDGHYINLQIENMDFGANTLYYEFVYKDGELTRGSNGEVNIAGKDTFDTELLLGSESSGITRFDEGVETGMLILQFRDGEGSVMAKPFSTDFHLQKRNGNLSSVDGEFEYELKASDKGDFFIVMESYGKPDKSTYLVNERDYIVFSSDNFVKLQEEE